MIVEPLVAYTAQQVVERWLVQLNAGLERRDYRQVASLFAVNGYWRDLLALTWDIRTAQGPRAIEAMLAEFCESSGLRHVSLEGQAATGALGEFGPTAEALVRFETDIASGRGHVRLLTMPDSEAEPRAVTFLTTMQDLKDFPQPSLRNRHREAMRLPEHGTANWLDKRIAEQSYADRDPQVLIVGAGQAGLTLAARLRQLDVDTLVVDRIERVGDNWRNRYHSLTLHNEICTNHLPYIPFPENWPVFIPKDKLANWMESYADSMELNVWTGTTFLSGEYDEAARLWTVHLRRPDGSTRIMRPSHVVMAIGVSGVPRIPKLQGMASFQGRVVHSSRHNSDIDVAEKSVLVVGSGTSAHDIAQDAYLRGGSVTMLQRSSITVVSIDQSARAYDFYRKNEGIRPIEDTDLLSASIPYDLLRQLHGPLSRAMAEADKPLLESLEKVGFLLDNGEDDTGFFLKLVRYHGGYYIDVGASDLIVDRKIALKSGIEIERVRERGVTFTDGTTLDVDVLVLATGYEPLQTAVAALFDEDMAKRVGTIWGLGPGNEMRNMWVRTGQPGFFVAGGPFTMCRIYSRYTALLIKAELEGLIMRDR
ncbi:MAG: hypothetical protein BGP04_05790 [Rhizobiales bacterium 62-17]|nr:NAD(P)/FAD-dependent oxidoreductase [Hyphomicrobiales bacterium]OJY01742.1 MAG: hypothetical protein BGP04_05790 [Rhizobiales bacterium 62-17]